MRIRVDISFTHEENKLEEVDGFTIIRESEAVAAAEDPTSEDGYLNDISEEEFA